MECLGSVKYYNTYLLAWFCRCKYFLKSILRFYFFQNVKLWDTKSFLKIFAILWLCVFSNINFLEQIFWLSLLIFLKAMAPQGAFIDIRKAALTMSTASVTCYTLRGFTPHHHLRQTTNCLPWN